MNIVSDDIQEVTAAPARVDMYTGIHKALRAFMADTLLAVGRMDCDDAVELAQVTQRVLELLGACASHLQHENEHVHVAMEVRAPGASDAIAHEHQDHLTHITRLGNLVADLRGAGISARPAAAQHLYRELSLFIADNFWHMQVEETAHNAVLWSRYTDAELIAIHDRLVASIPPEEMMAVARWMVPFMNPAERLVLLADIRGKAPAPAFQAILDTARPHLTTAEWAKLARGLGLAPVDGLVEA
ncbi:hypothetical protein FN976_28475 [Caenimonas sedimenti]|uniref:Hemerythrin-like domain-containing protein n=1 Tax=Caenimonas sedimenti TaxID=2596921 RepID=A0A562ZCX1_9BURK|nr:hemerythrin domain-containing protein [Caenimonas sedimenti]TWO63578.1 hypothetical protein FN976_28475 [Caenimonas sedimenti]